MQRAGWLVAMNLTELGHAQRQVAIALQAVFEDLYMARTVHWFAAEHPVVGCLGDIHILLELLPMAGLFPKCPFHHVGRIDLNIAPVLLSPPHIANQRLE